MARRKTHVEFVAEVEALVGSEYDVLGEYINSQTKIEVRHVNCGISSFVLPNNFLRGSRCMDCYGNRKKTTAEFKQEVFSLVGGEHTVLSDYKGANSRIDIKHNTCGNISRMTAASFLAGRRCKYCAKNRKKDTKTFIKDVREKFANEYTVLGEYVSSKTKIEVRHEECGHIYETAPSSFLQGYGCPKCSKHYLYSQEEYEEIINGSLGNEYLVISKYSGMKRDVALKHKNCGNSYKTKAISAAQGHGCPICKQSKGERKIGETLSKLHIAYEREYTLDDCRNSRALPFDFAVLNVDSSIGCFIEYDGAQHFRAVEFFGGEKGFRYRRQNDAIKTQYCADNGIPLIRIPYWEFDNIDEILTKELRKLDVSKTQEVAA